MPVGVKANISEENRQLAVLLFVAELKGQEIVVRQYVE